jgi:hypothetical protein
VGAQRALGPSRRRATLRRIRGMATTSPYFVATRLRTSKASPRSVGDGMNALKRSGAAGAASEPYFASRNSPAGACDRKHVLRAPGLRFFQVCFARSSRAKRYVSYDAVIDATRNIGLRYFDVNRVEFKLPSEQLAPSPIRLR